MPIFEVSHLVAGYGPIKALDGVSFDVNAGELIAIIGANGAGKTTLLMTISGVVPARSGSIRFLDQPINGLLTHEIVRLGVGHSPEGRRIFPRLTVRENLQLGGFTQPDRWQLKRDIAEACNLFPVLGTRMNQLGGTLSGGEQQMLALARALVGRPKLLMLDEPSLGLAPLVVVKIFEVIAGLTSRGLAVILGEQNARAALRLASRGYVLESGRITLSGSGPELLNDRRVRDAYLGE